MSPRRVTTITLVPVGLAVLLRALAPLWPPQSTWGHAVQALLYTAPQWLLLVSVFWSALGAWRARRPALLLVGAACLPFAGLPTLPADPPELRLVVANVNSFPDEDDPEALAAALAELGADVLVTVEGRGEHVPGLRRVADSFERSVPRPSHHSAAWCRPALDCVATVTEEVGSRSSRMPVVLVSVAGICVVGVHGPPPVPLDASGLIPYMDAVAGHLGSGRVTADWGPCRAGDPAVVAGDFNAVRGSPAYRRLTDRGFDDPERWRGVFAASWPAGGGWPNLPFFTLDHLLVRGVDARVLARPRLPGSDHKALVVGVNLPRAPAAQ